MFGCVKFAGFTPLEKKSVCDLNLVPRDLILDRKNNEVADERIGMSGVGTGGFHIFIHVFKWAILKTKYPNWWAW